LTDKKTFGAFIRSRRTAKNYSQKDLAELLFVTEGAVSKWERGVSYPDISLISDICRVLEISEHELITASTDTAARKQQHEARQFRIIRNVWFWVPTLSYLVALVVCFICNLAVNHTLSWFFIVLTALLCAYSFIPTFTSFFCYRKLPVFLVTSFVSICLLLLACGVYAHSIFWIPTACIGVLMGYTLIFLPILLAKTKLRFLLTFTLTFILTVLLLFSIRIWQPFMLVGSVMMTFYGFLPILLCCAVCLLRFDGFLKTGTCIALCAIAYYFTGRVVNGLFGIADNHYQVDFQNWKHCVNGNVHLIVLLTFLFLASVFFAIGIYRSKKNLRLD